MKLSEMYKYRRRRYRERPRQRSSRVDNRLSLKSWKKVLLALGRRKQISLAKMYLANRTPRSLIHHNRSLQLLLVLAASSTWTPTFRKSMMTSAMVLSSTSLCQQRHSSSFSRRSSSYRKSMADHWRRNTRNSSPKWNWWASKWTTRPFWKCWMNNLETLREQLINWYRELKTLI